MIRHYTYKGDRFTDPALIGAECTAVLRPDVKCICGRKGKVAMLVEFNGKKVIVNRRLLRKKRL